MPDPTADAAALAGQLAEYQAVLGAIDEAAGITVLSCVPCSGTSVLLAAAAAAEKARHPCLLVDGRRCRDVLDLAMGIADAAVRTLAAEAASWWFDPGSPYSTQALRLARSVSRDGIDLEDLRGGVGSGLQRLDDALRLARGLAYGRVTVILDHLGPLLWQAGPRGARELLGQLRATRQALPELNLIIADFADGPAVNALADAEHPLYRAGDTLPIARPEPQRFVDDLRPMRGATDVSLPLLGACADLARGSPAHTWRAVELAGPGADPIASALSGWRALRHYTDPATSGHWGSLRRLHPLAQTAAAVIASGLRPHGTIAANDKSIRDATRIMRALGLAWQPERRSWAIADPLLADYARDHSPAWVSHRHGRDLIASG